MSWSCLAQFSIATRALADAFIWKLLRFATPEYRFNTAGDTGLSLRACGVSYLWRKLPKMTQMEVAYRYANAPTETAMQAIDNMREVYGIRRVRFNEKEQIVRIEYDASRFKEPVVANLLRKAGVDIKEKLVLA